MQVTINIPTNAAGELLIPVRKTESDYPIRVTDVSAENLARLFLYGVTQVTNDCHASVKVDPERMSDDELTTAHGHVQAAIDKRWDAIYSGEWRVRTASGESANPIEREALSMAREATRLAYATARKANAKLPKWGDIDEAKRDAAANAFLDKNRADLMRKAQDRLDEKRNAASGINLADLGL
jgi:hypothetical protein